ncbi:MAG: ABC transporter permease [Candidatus Margulisbacteria bacterium]|nr:ABC transporter permease [Candidatus Margulisiibacteriota bacterium]
MAVIKRNKMALIELDKVTKTYYIGKDLPVQALRSVSLKIEPGEFVAIMGPSGSGKSTLLAILGLLDKAESGRYDLLGKNVIGLSDNEYAVLRSRYLGFIFQTFNLLPRFNVLENALLPFLYTEATPHDQQRVTDILRKIGLGDRLKHRSNEISGGQQQRVAIARALANSPQVIFADEPTGNLDSKSALEIIGLLKELNAQGTTIVMVTHERDLAEEASRIITLKDGVIVTDERKRTLPAAAIKEAARQKRKASISVASLFNYAHEAFLSLLANKLRSLLSILGVLIGVAAVIAMLAIGTGAKKSVEQTMASMGSNLLMVSASYRQQGISLGSSSSPTRFTFDDLAALKKIENVSRVSPNVSGRVQVVAQNKNWNTSVMGTTPDFQSVRNSIPDRGRFFTEEEVTSRAKVAVIGKTVATELFGDSDPIGQSVRVNRISFTVIGVLPEKGSSGFQNSDDRIVVPITTAMYRLLGEDYIRSFDVQVDDPDAIAAVQAAIIPVIGKLHRMTDAQLENVEVRNMAEMQKALTDVVNTFTTLLGAIAAVSLLVGGIGIMNIMLVLVMERTHEIGLRKALGAENRDIMIQFLVESVLICVLGGVLGILIGSLIAWIAASVFGWNALVSFSSIMLAFAFSVLVGMIFGIWPAWRAAKLLPIEALRYE